MPDTIEVPPTETVKISAVDAFRRASEATAAKQEAPVQKTEALAEKAVEKKDAIPESLLSGKQVEKATEAPADPWDVEPPKELSQKATIHFRKQSEAAKAKITALMVERDALRAEYETHKKNGGAPSEDIQKEITTLREKLNGMTADMEMVAYERSSAFQEKYTTREAAIRERATNILKDANADPALVDAILHSNGKARERILAEIEGLSEWQGRQLAVQMDRYDELQGEKKHDLSQAGEKLKASEAERAAYQRAEQEKRKAEESQVFESVAKKISETFEPFQKQEGEDEWNKGVEERLTQAREFYNGDGDLEKLAELAMYGLGAKKLHAMFKTVKDRLDVALAENARLKSAAPGIPQGGERNGNGHIDPNLPLGEAAKRAFNKASTVQ